MVKLDAKYGWIPTYDESIFIRQAYDNNSWRIEYSPVIASDTKYTPTDDNTALAAKQCYFFPLGVGKRPQSATCYLFYSNIIQFKDLR
ncbi:hypothetical protein ACN38_g12231 [Penicillium nordicum]|uniref:Uncharacterized protein n=1 Tax=Penicillium nordicum TaxID=229535 RepID=A0A0N0RXH0_9EURO|nr:hypothetical protein ACN38_g12231 [Penicillium nordicum]